MAGSPLTIPDELASLLNMLGYTWPTSDEIRMFELGGKWMEFGGKLQEIHGQATPHADNVSTENAGDDIDAFRKKFDDKDAGAAVIQDGGTGSMVVGGGLFVAAGIVLALKITVIVQLTILAVQIATAIASAGPTFGASMAWIPVAKKIADMALNLAIDLALQQILG